MLYSSKEESNDNSVPKKDEQKKKNLYAKRAFLYARKGAFEWGFYLAWDLPTRSILESERYN